MTQKSGILYVDRVGVHELIVNLRDALEGPPSEELDQYGAPCMIKSSEPNEQRMQHFTERLTLLLRQITQLDAEFHDEYDCP